MIYAAALLPRVTSVMASMGISFDYSTVDPAILLAASARGTLVHRMIEVAHQGIPQRILPHVAGYWAAYCRFTEEMEHEPIYSELVVEHPTWRYLGHLDRVGWNKRTTRALIDWKCVQSLDEGAVAIQLAAYELAYNVMYPQEPVHECAAVQLRSDGTYRYVVADTQAAVQVWKAALVVYHWRVQHSRVAPRIL